MTTTCKVSEGGVQDSINQEKKMQEAGSRPSHNSSSSLLLLVGGDYKWLGLGTTTIFMDKVPVVPVLQEKEEKDNLLDMRTNVHIPLTQTKLSLVSLFVYFLVVSHLQMFCVCFHSF